MTLKTNARTDGRTHEQTSERRNNLTQVKLLSLSGETGRSNNKTKAHNLKKGILKVNLKVFLPFISARFNVAAIPVGSGSLSKTSSSS